MSQDFGGEPSANNAFASDGPKMCFMPRVLVSNVGVASLPPLSHVRLSNFTIGRCRIDDGFERQHNFLESSRRTVVIELTFSPRLDQSRSLKDLGVIRDRRFRQIKCFVQFPTGDFLANCLLSEHAFHDGHSRGIPESAHDRDYLLVWLRSFRQVKSPPAAFVQSPDMLPLKIRTRVERASVFTGSWSQPHISRQSDGICASRDMSARQSGRKCNSRRAFTKEMTEIHDQA